MGRSCERMMYAATFPITPTPSAMFGFALGGEKMDQVRVD